MKYDVDEKVVIVDIYGEHTAGEAVILNNVKNKEGKYKVSLDNMILYIEDSRIMKYEEYFGKGK